MLKIRSVLTAAVAVLWAVLAVWAWVKPADTVSVAERRPLAQLPEWTAQELRSGEAIEGFERYAVDQFPFRDRFRQVKALFHYNIMGQKDNNGIYLVGDTAAKLVYPLNEASVDHGVAVLQGVYDRYLKDTDCRIYQAVVPDKGYYLAQPNGYPAMDYEALFRRMEELSWAQPIRLTDCLTARDYYRTDTHWRQERLLSAAERICQTMGTRLPGAFTERALDVPFYGVYYGQAALPMEPEQITVLDSDLLEGCTVYNYENGKTAAVYDMDKLGSRDLYDVYLSGAAALLRIENPTAKTGRELVVFRDSFGSSMVPLLVQGYETVTVVDLRYMSASLLGQFLEFEDQDVLMMYSTLVLNESATLKG